MLIIRRSPVPKTPITGTAIDNLPLDSVGCWFHIMENIPRYRNHFFRRMGDCPPHLPVASVGSETGRPYAAIDSGTTSHRPRSLPSDAFWRQQERGDDPCLPDRLATIPELPGRDELRG